MFFSFETYEFHDDLVDCLSWKIWYLKRILFEDFVAVLLFEGWRGAENWCSLQEIGALFILAEATVWDGTMGWNEIATVNHEIAPAFIIIIDHDHDRRVLVGRADVHSNFRAMPMALRWFAVVIHSIMFVWECGRNCVQPVRLDRIQEALDK